MPKKITVFLLCVLICTTSMAAHIVTDTRVGNTLIKRTDTYANSSGDLRIDERGYGSSVSMSASAVAGSADAAKVDYQLGKIQDTTLFQTKDGAIVSLEGKICRRLTADSAAPPGLGMPGANLGDMNRQMGDAMKQAKAAMRQAMQQARKEGMTAEQERALKQFTQPFQEVQNVKPRGALQFTPLNQKTKVGRYSAEGFLISDSEGQEKHRVWVVPVKKVSGGKDVRRAMEGMLQTYEKYLDKMGGGALMDTGLTSILMHEDFEGTYPVRIEDLDSGEITDVVEASASDGGVEFYPACEERDMMGMQ